MKVFVHYKEGTETDLRKTLKLTIPKKWLDKSPTKVLDLFIESYNARNSNALDPSAHHLENKCDMALKEGDLIKNVMKDKGDVHVRPGATEMGMNPIPSENVPDEKPIESAPDANVSQDPGPIEGQKRCHNFGCHKYYTDEENNDLACKYHTGPPVFHDTKKGWTCCPRRVYDWDEFQLLEGCTVGHHSDKKQDVTFGNSPTVAAAKSAGGDNEPQIYSISEFNSANPNATTAANSAAKSVLAPVECTRRYDGTATCLNKGCQQDFVIEENTPTSCHYHKDAPVFHDVGKYWGCCPDKVKYDFDSFMKVKGCCIGYHNDGSAKAY
eukprot:398061_1